MKNENEIEIPVKEISVQTYADLKFVLDEISQSKIICTWKSENLDQLSRMIKTALHDFVRGRKAPQFSENDYIDMIYTLSLSEWLSGRDHYIKVY